MTKQSFVHWRSYAEIFYEDVKKQIDGTPVLHGYEAQHAWTMKKMHDVMRGVRRLNPNYAETEGITLPLQLYAEWQWNHYGRPYYKVWPGMAEMLSEVTFNIPVSYLHTPFPVISVLLPCDLPPSFAGLGAPHVLVAILSRDEYEVAEQAVNESYRHIFGSVPAKAMFNKTLQETEKQHGCQVKYFMAMYYRTKSDISRQGVDIGAFTAEWFLLMENETVDQALEKRGISRWYVTKEDEKDNDWLDRRTVERLTRLILATCCFATDSHEQILPDIEREVILRKWPNRRGKSQRYVDQQRAKEWQRRLNNCRGWLVGSEIDLPRPIFARRGDKPEPTGYELQYSHIRSGHLRLQPCGPGKQDRKLVFIPPTQVRPDLPLPPVMKGHRLTDKVLSKKKS